MYEVKPQDISTLRDLENLATEIWREHYTSIIGIDQVNYMLKKFQSVDAMTEQIQSGYSYYTVFLSNELVGYFSVQPREDILFLSKAYLVESARGKGIFSKMLEKITLIAEEHDLSKIELTVNKENTNSINVYKSKNFNVTHEAVFDIGNGYVMDDFVLLKEI